MTHYMRREQETMCFKALTFFQRQNKFLFILDFIKNQKTIKSNYWGKNKLDQNIYYISNEYKETNEKTNTNGTKKR